MSDPQYVMIGSPQIKVVEECSELIKAICKAERFGWDSYHPATPTISNKQKVLAEMKDVIDRCVELKEMLEERTDGQ